MNTVKQGHPKVLHINHTVLEMADYLKPNGIINSEARFLFMVRSRMLEARKNFEAKHTTHCVPCVQHLLVCEELLVSRALVDSLPDYQNLLGNELKEKIGITRIIQEKFKLRKIKLKEEN